MIRLLFTALKGMAMGAANVIPGVSGGTIALITGIFERLINAIKSFDFAALRLVLKGDIKSFIKKTDLYFILALFAGIGFAIVSLAKLLDYLFEYFPVYVWSFFFGLVLASVWFVGKSVKRWHLAAVVSFLIGTLIAIGISIMSPANENSAAWYLFICGIVAMCSMILPGLSGSFVLILMGNYQLVMIDAVSKLKLDILLPVAVGAAFGLLAFSHLLSWLLRRFYDSTMALLTGFIMGSLGILWPWKEEVVQTFGNKTKVVGYIWQMPQPDMAFVFAFVLCFVGIAAISLTETLGRAHTKKTS